MGSPSFAHDSVTITYTVKGRDPSPTTVPVARPAPMPAVTHQPLPYTGAPVTLELIGSFALLLVGALAALSAHRGRHRQGAVR